jgi:hypothetical protein
MERLKLDVSSVGFLCRKLMIMLVVWISCLRFFIDVGCGWYVRGRELEGTVEGRIGVYAARMMRRSFVTTSSRCYENLFRVQF